MNIIFLGPPGSGKGTQAKRLANHFGLLHLSTGDAFRSAIEKKTAVGLKIKSFVDSGQLVPDEVVSDVVFEKIRSGVPAAGVLLDGYPRTLNQAKALSQFAGSDNFLIDAVIFFEVNSEDLVERLSSRRQCPKCQDVYNLVTRPPKVKETCDLCSGTLVQRPDDKAEVVRDRLVVYEKQTAPLLAFYEKESNFYRINAANKIDQVYAELLGIFQNRPVVS